MAQPYIGEIRLFAGNFAPQGWATCDGQLIAISENAALFQLIGTTYGGDGQNTFALPNLAARVPIHTGSNGTSTYTIGENGGVTSVTLTTAQIPSHTHPVIADANTATTTASSPANGVYGDTTPTKTYAAAPTTAMMTLPSAGGSQPHDNMQPYLAVTYIISLFGVFPSQT